MRTALVVVVILFAAALLLPVTETNSLPLSGVKLVKEQRASTPELLAAGKNGKTGKNSNNGKNGKSHTFGSAGVLKGGLGPFGFRSLVGGMGGPDLVTVDLR